MTKTYMIDNLLYDISFSELYHIVNDNNPNLFGYQISDEFSYNPFKYLKFFGVFVNDETNLYIKSQIKEICNDFKEYTNLMFVLHEAKYRIHSITKKYTGKMVSKMLIEKISQEVFQSIQQVQNEYGIHLNKFKPKSNISEYNGTLTISFDCIEK